MKRIIAFTIVALTIGFTSCFYFGTCFEGTGMVTTETRTVSDFTSVNNSGSFEVYVTQADSFSVKVTAQSDLIPIIETSVSGSTLIIKTANNVCYRTSIPVIVDITMPEIEQLTLSGSGLLSTPQVSAGNLEVSLSGSGRLYVDTVRCDELLVVHSASGKIYSEVIEAPDAAFYLSGSGILDAGLVESIDFSVQHSASGTVHVDELTAEKVTCNLSGSGRIELTGYGIEGQYVNSASGRIDALDLETGTCSATTSGSGSILLYATDFLEANVLGSGSILYTGNPEITYYRAGTGELRRY